MKYFTKKTLIGFLIAGSAVPLMAFALTSFTGTCTGVTGKPGTSPKDCNVPGVIWNLPPGSPPQTANINIAGSVKTSNINIAEKTTVQDIFTADTKNLIVVPATAGAISNFFIKSQEIGTLFSGLKLNVVGSIIAQEPSGYPGPFIPGKDGRIHAHKFCFNPGAAADCITAWSGPGGPGGGGGGGSFVSKTGDTMTGELFINSSGFAGIVATGTFAGGSFENKTNSNQVHLGLAQSSLIVEGGADGTSPAARIFVTNKNVNGLEVLMRPKSAGVGITIGKDVLGTIDGFEPTKGIVSYANKIGGEFWGTDYGIDAKSHAIDATTAGTGTAVRGSNGRTGGDFSGSVYGTISNGGTHGSYFTNSLFENTYIAYPGYGILTDNLIFTSSDIVASGNISAVNNVPEHCTWQSTTSTGDFICSANKFLTGIRKQPEAEGNADVIAIRCCNL